MRIIGGALKSREIETLDSLATRPTSNQTREAIFNLLGQEFSGGLGLDLFAGSGAMGLEAMSRGLERFIFVDKSKQATHLIEKNIRTLDLTDRSRVLTHDGPSALSLFASEGLKFNLIFLDPPYDAKNHEELIVQLQALDLLADHYYIICETDKRNELPDTIENCQKWKERRYGKARVTIYH